MKNPFFLVFTLLNVLVLSCANKGPENQHENLLTPAEAKIQALLDKDFNEVLAAPSIAAPEFTSSEKASPKTIVKGTIEGTPVRSVYLQELTKEEFKLIDSALVDAKGNFSFTVSSLTEPTICFITFNSANPLDFL